MLGMPTDEVNRPALAEVIEGVLDQNRPAMAAQIGCDGVHKRCMGRVEHPRQVPATPAGLNCEPHLERLSDASQRPQRQLFEKSTLGEGDQLLANTGSLCHIGLPQAHPLPDGTKRATNAEIIHQPDGRRRYVTHHLSGA